MIPSAYSLLCPLGLELPLECLHSLSQLSDLAIKLLVLGLKHVGVAFLGSPEAALDEIDSVLRLLGFFVEADEDLSELINDPCLFKELTELLLLLFSSLYAHFRVILYYIISKY